MGQRRRHVARRLVIMAGVVALLVTAGCGSGKDQVTRVKVLGTDANTGQSFAQAFRGQPGAIVAMRGTTPMSKLSDDFLNRLKQRNPALTDFTFAAESYDATIVTALAAQTARTSHAAVFAPFIDAVTTGGQSCNTFQQCVSVIDAGGDIDYDGVSGGLDFTDPGEPAVGSYGLIGYDDASKPVAPTYLMTGDPKNASTKPPPPRPTTTTGGSLRLGALLPQTGGLSAYGPGMLAAVQLAVADINAAGGVNRADVTVTQADDGTDPAVAQRAVRGLLNDSVDAIIGPGSSSVCKGVIDSVISAGVLLFSPASTSDEFTSYNDRGLFFRTAPPDALQARLLANIIVQEGGRVVGLMYQNTTYGLGLATAIQHDLVASGEVAKDNIVPVRYDPASVDFGPYIKRLREKRPDFIVVVGYDESPRIVKALNRAGLGPKR